MAARSIRRAATFSHTFPFGVTMELRRLQAWDWDGVKASAVAAGAQIREGGAALIKYGFEEEEFDTLADPAKWEGAAEFIFAVELGVFAILSVTGMAGENGEVFQPGEFEAVSFLMRHQEIRGEFLRIMNAEGSVYALEAAEGNASAPSPNISSAGAPTSAVTA